MEHTTRGRTTGRRRQPPAHRREWILSGSLLLTGLALLVASLVGFSFSSILWGAAGEGSTDNLGGIGVVVVMGFAGAGFLLSLAVGFWGLSIFLLGVARVLRK